jgi:hypothetical protein
MESITNKMHTGPLTAVTGVCAAQVQGEIHAGVLIIGRTTYAVKAQKYVGSGHICGLQAPASCLTATVLRRVGAFVETHYRDRSFRLDLYTDDAAAVRLMQDWSQDIGGLPPWFTSDNNKGAIPRLMYRLSERPELVHPIFAPLGQDVRGEAASAVLTTSMVAFHQSNVRTARRVLAAGIDHWVTPLPV